jgi:hypothetical protein
MPASVCSLSWAKYEALRFNQAASDGGFRKRPDFFPQAVAKKAFMPSLIRIIPIITAAYVDKLAASECEDADKASGVEIIGPCLNSHQNLAFNPGIESFNKILPARVS